MQTRSSSLRWFVGLLFALLVLQPGCDGEGTPHRAGLTDAGPGMNAQE